MSKKIETTKAKWPPQIPLGVGTMNWSGTIIDSKVAGKVLSRNLLREIVELGVSHNVTFYDTAEGYGNSEVRLRRAFEDASYECDSNDIIVSASKFLPTLWRWSSFSFVSALKRSNQRMNLKSSELYFIHSPIHPRPLETWVYGACRAYRLGYLKRLGLSNCNADEVRRAAIIAQKAGLPIVANQIQFSLLTAKSPKLQETIAECKRRNIKIIAYSTLGQGLLAKPDLTREKAEKLRIFRITKVTWNQVQPLRHKIREISSRYPGYDMSHVCLAWARQKDTIPLVGVRKKEHLTSALKSLSLTLTDEEMHELDSLALPKHTFEKPRWRRSIFVIFISLLVFVYRLVEFFFSASSRHHGKWSN